MAEVFDYAPEIQDGDKNRFVEAVDALKQKITPFNANKDNLWKALKERQDSLDLQDANEEKRLKGIKLIVDENSKSFSLQTKAGDTFPLLLDKDGNLESVKVFSDDRQSFQLTLNSGFRPNLELMKDIGKVIDTISQLKDLARRDGIKAFKAEKDNLIADKVFGKTYLKDVTRVFDSPYMWLQINASRLAKVLNLHLAW